MFANDDKPLRIALLGISERDRHRLRLFLDKHWPCNRLVVAEERADLCILGPGSVNGHNLIPNLHDYCSSFPLILLSVRGQDFIQLVKLPLLQQASYGKDLNIIKEEALWPSLNSPEKHGEGCLQSTFNQPISSPHVQASNLTIHCPNMAYGAAICQSKTAAYLPTEHITEVFLLNIGWRELSRQQLNLVNTQQQPIDNVIDFNRIADERAGSARQLFNGELRQRQIENKLLKRFLTVTKRRLDGSEDDEAQASLALGQAGESLKHAEAEATGDVKLKTEFKQVQKRLATTEERLEKTLKLNEEYRQQNLSLQTQLQQLQENSEAFRKQSAQDLSRLSGERFDLECTLQQLQEQLSGDKTIEQRQINALQQSLTETQAAHEKRERELLTTLDESNSNAERTVEALNSEIKQLRQSQLLQAQALEESQAQLALAQAEFQAQQERLDRSLEAEKAHGSEEVSRLNAVIEDLGAQLKAVRTKAILQKKKRLKLEALLKREHKTARHFQNLTNTTKREAEITNERLAAAEQTQQELLAELQQEISAGQEAWEKASESDIAMQVAKFERTSLKNELELEIANLRAQLEHLQESSNAAQSEHFEMYERLQKSLAESQSARKEAEANINSLRSERQSLRKAKADYEQQLAQLEAKLKARQTKLAATIISDRQKMESLRQELSAAKAKKTDPAELENLRQALRQAEEEKASLKRRINGLREVQLKMERELNKEKDREIATLRSALEAAEAKLKKSEEPAQPIDELRHEADPVGYHQDTHSEASRKWRGQDSKRPRNRPSSAMSCRMSQAQEKARKMHGKDSDTVTKKKGALIRKPDRQNKLRISVMNSRFRR